MRAKYILLASALVMNLLLFSSCLNSSVDDVEYSPDAQIYAFSLSSDVDTTSLLSNTVFTIDQLNGIIFNEEPLPFQFNVDSVLLSISGQSSYGSFTQVSLQLISRDSTYDWVEGDSVAVNRLRMITTRALDGVTTKKYYFELNIYQQDPYILNWENKKRNYLPTPVTSQKTVAFNDQFITYYQSGVDMKAMTSSSTDGVNWIATQLTGMPNTIALSSLITSDNAVFALDRTTEKVYQSTNGANWTPVTTPFTVKAIYGNLPSTVGGEILIAVNHKDTLTFAETADFTEMTLMNKVPETIPVKDFSAAKVDDQTSYSIKYILLAGGTRADTAPNNDLWILQKKNGEITSITSRVPPSVTLRGSNLFFYDNKPYLMTVSTVTNILYYSDNSGLDWIEAEDNQTFPAEFEKRTDASIITDAENYIWIFGGISPTQAQLVDVWRGILNKFAGI